MLAAPVLPATAAAALQVNYSIELLKPSINLKYSNLQ
jgi:hypothetical protein